MTPAFARNAALACGLVMTCLAAAATAPAPAPAQPATEDARLAAFFEEVFEREAPERILVPSGSRIRIDYSGERPILAARIQEMFGLAETPRLARGRVPLLLHLLAPSGRPQQVTDDLESFWANTYAVVRKELRRRYPKHAWPEDPLTASPTRKAR